MSYSPTLFSGMYTFLLLFIHSRLIFYSNISARRNAQGLLEPDAAEDVVQNSLGFGGYEHAPKPEHRKEGASSSSSSS
jgi:cytochrome c oxidase assembly protein subunit 11